MEERIVGTVQRVNGPVVGAKGITNAVMLEMVRVGEMRIVGEIIKIKGSTAIVQVYEDTTGISPGENIYGSGMPMSVELGPGLIGTIYDGIQRPLESIYAMSQEYIERGINLPSLARDKTWYFIPASVSTGTIVREGEIIGTCQETSQILHKILVPPGIEGTLTYIAEEGSYTVTDVIAKVLPKVSNAAGGASKGAAPEEKELTMMQTWAIRKARPTAERLPLGKPLVSGQRVIDTLFPLAKGGTVVIPGGFGTGKTMIQHAIAKWCDADIIVYIGCGERGNEMTDVLTEFPKLIDPRTGQSLMNRTILIANTSNMPVSAREASIYTGVTLAEYYRDQGYDVAVMADSTSRWAEALRELSGRMEEMPAEEGFPAYLPTRIAEFYERAGYMRLLSGEEGSVSIIGAVSPPGGDFSEPVTQHTRRFVRCFWGLDRQLANARHYPAISWLESYSEYMEDLLPWWEQKLGFQREKDRTEMMELLHREVRLQQVVKLVGPDALPDSQRFIIEVCTVFKNAFLQQNAFDDIDRYSTLEKQTRMLALILLYWRRGQDAIKKGITIVRVRKMRALQDVIKMKFTIGNDQMELFDKLEARLERGFDQLESLYV